MSLCAHTLQKTGLIQYARGKIKIQDRKGLEECANGQTLLDDAGVELRDIAAARNQALRASSEIFRAGPRATATLWNGTPWRMWVTDNPNGEGKTFFTLRFSAAM